MTSKESRTRRRMVYTACRACHTAVLPVFPLPRLAVLHFLAPGARLCDGSTRREAVRAGGLAALGLTLPDLLRARAAESRTKNCIVLFLLGGPPQHSTWDPKPDAPAEVRGEFGPIDTAVPGMRIASLFPLLAKQADKLCLLRAVATGDNAHSSSGYYMLTGVPHLPLNSEGAKPGAPNDFPTLGAAVRKFRGDRNGLPGAVRLPMHIFNTDSSVWPGQDAGFLGRGADPWLLRCEPAAPDFRIPAFTLTADVPPARLADRRDLLQQLDRGIKAAVPADGYQAQAFDLLASASSRAAFDLGKVPPAVRDRYGRTPFGQSCLLARRLVEAGVGLVQVNWHRGPDEPPDNPCWDSHMNETQRLKTALAPTLDRAFAALIEDLAQSGLLDDTLVACVSEFGRTPRFNTRGGREHWGHVFSVALAGGGVKGGTVYGASDKIGGQPKEGLVRPEDLTATILHCLGYGPQAEVRDRQGRPHFASSGDVIRAIL